MGHSERVSTKMLYKFEKNGTVDVKNSVGKERITLKIIKKHVEELMIVKPFMSKMNSIFNLKLIKNMEALREIPLSGRIVNQPL